MARRRKFPRGGGRLWFELAVIGILTGLAAYLGNWGGTGREPQNNRPAAVQAKQSPGHAAQAKKTAPPQASAASAILNRNASQGAGAQRPVQGRPAAAKAEARPGAAGTARPATPPPVQAHETAPAKSISSVPGGTAAPAGSPIARTAPSPAVKPPPQAPATPRIPDRNTCRLTYAADGDSFEMKDSRGATVRVRLFGIDAPEFKQPFGQESRANALRLMAGRRLLVTPMYKDNYQRTVAVVRVVGQDGRADALSVNERQVQAGMAWVYDYFCTADMCSTWKLEEAMAQRQRLGLWRDASAIPPWQWRRTHRRH